MKNISTRNELIDLVNSGIETFEKVSDDKKKIMNTIIKNKKNGLYYRITWGFIKDENNERHLWYKPEIERVTLNKVNASWVTSKEEKDYINKNEDNVSWLYKNGLLFINGETRNFEEEDKVSIVAGKRKAGKSEYGYAQVAKYLRSDKNVLFISTKHEEKEVARRTLRALMGTDVYSNFEEGVALDAEGVSILNDSVATLQKGFMEIISNCEVEENFIIDKMYENKATKGLDLVVIDSLSFIPQNIENLLRIHKKMDCHRQFLDCKVIMITQIDKDVLKEDN